MKHYAVAEIDVTDPAWVRDYLAQVTPMVQRRGGRYLARTGAAERIEGEREPSQVMLIIEWPSRRGGRRVLRERGVPGRTAKHAERVPATSSSSWPERTRAAPRSL